MGAHGTTHHVSTLRDYLNVARRRKWIIVQAVVLVPLAALAFSLHQEKRFQASSQVLLSRQNLASSLTGAQDPSVYTQADRIAQTQADVARVPAVAARALRSAGVANRTVEQLLAESTVSAAQNADLLTFSVTDADPQIARRLVDAYAGSFTIYRRQLDTASIQRALSGVQVRIRQLESAGDRKSSLYASLVEREQQLATMEALQTSNASVVQRSSEAVQVQPRPKRNAILGLALGIVLGVGLAFLWEALDTRVRASEEVGERLGGVPLLTRLGEPARKVREHDGLVMLDEPNGVQAESFRMLRTNLDFVRLDRDVKTVMVTSAVQQEGKSTTVANLAVALARAGQRVILVDLDLRRPYLHRFFGLEGPGITQVALGRARLDEALAPVVIGGAGKTFPLPVNGNGNGKRRVYGLLEVLPAGPIPPDPGEFVGTQALGEILADLRGRADVVLIDSPPVLHVGDAMTLSSKVDGLIVVARMNVVRRHMLNELRRLLERMPAQKLGFVLTAAAEEQAYGAGYSYGYDYAAAPETARLGAVS